MSNAVNDDTIDMSLASPAAIAARNAIMETLEVAGVSLRSDQYLFFESMVGAELSSMAIFEGGGGLTKNKAGADMVAVHIHQTVERLNRDNPEI